MRSITSRKGQTVSTLRMTMTRKKKRKKKRNKTMNRMTTNEIKMSKINGERIIETIRTTGHMAAVACW